MPRTSYETTDNQIIFPEFDEYALSDENTERLYAHQDRATLSVAAKYRFDDGNGSADILFEEDGSWRDGAPVTITVESDQQAYCDAVCEMLEEHWF